MTDFSQSSEQSFILEWANRHGPGRFLDIGAADGTSASNSRALALRGWSGVCVEPAAILFDKLASVYENAWDIECVQAAVIAMGKNECAHCGLIGIGSPGPLVRFHMSHDLVSTTQDENAETWKDLVSFVPVYVAAVTVQQLLAAFPGPYEFITVDSEGTSLEIARALLDHDALAPGGLLCVECEDGGERWEAQQWCLDGFARVGVTPNNLILERL